MSRMAGLNVALYLVLLPGLAAANDPLDPSLIPTIVAPPLHPNIRLSHSLTTQKVLKERATPLSAAEGGASTLHLFAARNEFEAFQVHITNTTANPFSFTGISVTPFAHQNTVDSIPASNVEVFRQGHINVTQRSQDPNSMQHLGHYPDALIPAVAGGQATNAFSNPPATGETQSFWVEVFVPPTAASGYYTADVQIALPSQQVLSFPLLLSVWDFELPSTSSLPTAFHLSHQAFCTQIRKEEVVKSDARYACAHYPDPGYPATTSDTEAIKAAAEVGSEESQIAIAKMFLDHRITIANAVYAQDVRDWNAFGANHLPLLNGTATGLRLSGARMTSIGYSDPNALYDDNGVLSEAGRANLRDRLREWMWRAEEQGWSKRLHFYRCDEPTNPGGNCPNAAVAKEEGSTVRHAGYQDIPYLLTTDVDPQGAVWTEVKDLVGIVAPTINQLTDDGAATARPSRFTDWLNQAPSRENWWYLSCNTFGCGYGIADRWPTYLIDTDPVSNRIFQWMSKKYGPTGELFWKVDACFFNYRGAPGPCGTEADPWESQFLYGGNGDGTLYYPGTQVRLGTANQLQLPVPLPSVRLKHIRDGLEDYEYMVAAEAQAVWPVGLDADLTEVIHQGTAHSLIHTSRNFTQDPEVLRSARRALGDALHAARHQDVNGCARNLHNCDEHATCTNTTGGFTRACNAGFSGNGVVCADTNECAAPNVCGQPWESCINRVGSFICSDCRPEQVSTDAHETLSVQVSSCRDIQARAHFDFARGAYANAQMFEAELSLASSCPEHGNGCLYNSLAFDCPMGSQVQPGGVLVAAL